MTDNEKRAAELCEALGAVVFHNLPMPEAQDIILESLNAAQAEGYKQGAESKWLPIESAPKGGTVVFLWVGNAEFPARYEGSWREPAESELWVSGSDEPETGDGTFSEEAGWFSDEGYTCKLQGATLPTHWMPLPTPPADDNGGA